MPQLGWEVYEKKQEVMPESTKGHFPFGWEWIMKRPRGAMHPQGGRGRQSVSQIKPRKPEAFHWLQNLRKTMSNQENFLCMFKSYRTRSVFTIGFFFLIILEQVCKTFATSCPSSFWDFKIFSLGTLTILFRHHCWLIFNLKFLWQWVCKFNKKCCLSSHSFKPLTHPTRVAVRFSPELCKDASCLEVYSVHFMAFRSNYGIQCIILNFLQKWTLKCHRIKGVTWN